MNLLNDSNQLFSLSGAVLVLYAFLGSSFWGMNREGVLYSLLNFFGTALLGLSVISPLNFGILVVETVWCFASFWLFMKAVKGKG